MKYLIPYSLIIILYLIVVLCCLQTTIISWFIQNITNIEIIAFICFIFFLFGSISLILYTFIDSDANTAEKYLIKLTLITFPIVMTFTAIYTTYKVETEYMKSIEQTYNKTIEIVTIIDYK